MAVTVSMVSGRESEQELAESHLMLKNSWFCFRISTSFVTVGNNPSLRLQIHSFSLSEDRRKCNKTGNPSISYFPTILTSHILIFADSLYFPSGEAYRQHLSFSIWNLATSGTLRYYDIIDFYDIIVNYFDIIVYPM
jgi:hypothetical protein